MRGLPYMAGVPDDQEIARRFARRFRALRLAAGVSQAEVARRCGMSRPNIARLEAVRDGAHVPRIDTVLRYAAAIGATPSEVLCVLDPT